MSLRLFAAVLGAASLTALVASCASKRDDTPAPAPTPTPTGSVPPVPVKPATCAEAAADITVANVDLNGYPPYAVAGCTLVYVNASGALVMRDLTTAAESPVAEASETPHRPAISTDVLAWEATEGGHTVVRVRVRASGVTRTVAGTFVAAGEPRVSAASVVFTGWNGPAPADDTDVWLYDATADAAKMVLGGPAQQRYADVSAAYVAAADFSEDPDGRDDHNDRDLADIIVLNRATGAIVKRHVVGFEKFPMLASTDVVAYLHWPEIHPEPKLQAYEIRSGIVGAADPATDAKVAFPTYGGDYARPAINAATLEWIGDNGGSTALWRAPADGSSAPVQVQGLPSGLRLFAPAPTAAFTVVATATSATGGVLTPRLRAVPR